MSDRRTVGPVTAEDLRDLEALVADLANGTVVADAWS